MTYDQIKAKFPNASRSFLQANSPRTVAVLERPACDEPLETNQSQEGTAKPVHIRFTSVRKRLCDPDNLCVKWLLDCLRYCGAIEGDEPEKISLEVKQKKVYPGEPEHTLIEVEYP